MARSRRKLSKKSKSRSGLVFNIKSSVLREIWGITYFGLAVITFLSIQKSFGIVGEAFLSVIQPMLGWGVYILPVFFLGSSLLLFFSKNVSFALSRILGIFLIFSSLLSIFHLSVPMDVLYKSAQEGGYGGYVGFVTNFIFREVFQIGTFGSSAVFIIFFLIGTLLAFEISIVNVLAFLKPELKVVRRRTLAAKQDEDEDEILDLQPESALEAIEAMDDKDFEKKHDHDSEEMITIKRAQIASANADESKSFTKSIVIKEEDEDLDIQNDNAKSTSAVQDEDYVWTPPPFDLLNPPVADVGSDDALLKDNAEKIRDKLSQFGIEVSMHEVHVGPTVIQYTLRPDEGIKLSKITALKNDLALALAAKAIRIEAPIPGKSLVGIEVPNDHRTLVQLREILESKEFDEIKSNLRFPLGRDVSGKPMCGDLAAMPHLLIAGATGAGKSVGMNTFLISLLYQNSPYDLKLILIDPKRVELTTYNGIPHLLAPVITDPEKAAIALRWAVAEMNRRYQLCAENGHRNITDFNACQEKHNPESEVLGHQRMSNIVIVIDELADLMMAAGKEVEASICRIAQMARAVGMHLVLATQRPSVDVITGLIKANIPARIAFAVSSSIDSRTILDSIGAEDLLGKGDMLYLPGGMSKPVRIQGIYISSKEIERVTNHIKVHGIAADYVDEITSPKVAQERIQGIPQSSLADGDDDSLYQQALQVISESRKASASLLQRRLKVGYARAARLLDLMEERGVIGPVNGAKPRDIYLD